MKEWLIDYWNDHDSNIIMVFWIALGIIIFILFMAFLVHENIEVYELTHTTKGYQVIYNEKSIGFNYVHDELFLTKEGALLFIKMNDKGFYNELIE